MHLKITCARWVTTGAACVKIFFFTDFDVGTCIFKENVPIETFWKYTE